MFLMSRNCYWLFVFDDAAAYLAGWTLSTPLLLLRWLLGRWRLLVLLLLRWLLRRRLLILLLFGSSIGVGVFVDLFVLYLAGTFQCILHFFLCHFYVVQFLEVWQGAQHNFTIAEKGRFVCGICSSKWYWMVLLLLWSSIVTAWILLKPQISEVPQTLKAQERNVIFVAFYSEIGRQVWLIKLKRTCQVVLISNFRKHINFPRRFFDQKRIMNNGMIDIYQHVIYNQISIMLI